jgi:type IV pilus assembly protein PilC
MQINFLKKNIKPQIIILFIQQLAHFLQAGMDILSALDLLIQSQTIIFFKNILLQIKEHLKQGKSVSDAFSLYPQYFIPLTRQLVYIGEQSGKLDKMLLQAAHYQESEEELKKKIRSALFYPFIVCITAAVVTSLLLLFVIPQFVGFFAQANAPLPMLTKIVIQCSEFFKHYFFITLLILATCIISLLLIKKRSLVFSYYLDRCFLRIPLLGKCIQEKMILQCSSALASTCNAGLPLLDSLSLLIPLTQHPVYQLSWLQIKKEVTQGQSLATAMNNTHQFPALCIQLIHSGEETGQLEMMLAELARLTSINLEHKLQRFKECLEPAMMLVLGIIVGTLIVAMYLPIFKLGTIV